MAEPTSDYFRFCSDCGKKRNSSQHSLPNGEATCRPCRRLRRMKPCERCGEAFYARDNEARFCGRECWQAVVREASATRPTKRRKPRPNKKRSDPRLGGRVRTRVAAQVRARTDEPVCPLCGYLIDRSLPRMGSRHPLCSVIDEWLPRAKGGEVSVDNCVEVHDRCNVIKWHHWPVTADIYERCEVAVRDLLMEHMTASS